MPLAVVKSEVQTAAPSLGLPLSTSAIPTPLPALPIVKKELAQEGDQQLGLRSFSGWPSAEPPAQPAVEYDVKWSKDSRVPTLVN